MRERIDTFQVGPADSLEALTKLIEAKIPDVVAEAGRKVNVKVKVTDGLIPEGSIAHIFIEFTKSRAKSFRMEKGVVETEYDCGVFNA